MSDGSAGEPGIEARGLCRYYGPFTAIEELSFSVSPGQVTAFLGPNGAGKTTTMKILTGFLAPSRGRAFVAGFDVDLDRIAASRHLGYMPENGPLDPQMTPAGFLRFVGRIRGLAGSELGAACERVAANCRLEEVWRKPIGKLSKGFRQRVGLAQALLHDPQVLILDEPTAGLDPNQIRLVRELIDSLRGERSILLSTHILQEVEAIADRVILISEGRLRFAGTPAEMAAEEGLEERFCRLTGGVVT